MECRNYRRLVRALEERWPGIEEALTKTAVAINGQIYQDAWLEPIAPGSECSSWSGLKGVDSGRLTPADSSPRRASI